MVTSVYMMFVGVVWDCVKVTMMWDNSSETNDEMFYASVYKGKMPVS